MISSALHRLAHWLDPGPCRCSTSSYMKGWRVAHQAQEQRYRLIRAGVDVRDADRYEAWLREAS